jgi:hypothetical protein
MASEMMEYLADKVNVALTRGVGISVPANLKIKIYETLPDRDGTGGTETDYTSYVAQTVACGASSKWDAPSTVSGARVIKNSEAIVFPESTDVTPASCAGYVVTDASDNPLWFDTKAFTVSLGFVPRIEIGAMVFGFKSTAAASYDMQDKVLNAICRNTAFAALTSIDVEEYVTLPSKVDDSGGTKATYTGYAKKNLISSATVSDWDAPGDDGIYRMVQNTAAFDCGTANTSGAQTLAGFCLRNNTGDGLLFVGTYSPTLPIAIGTKMSHHAAGVKIEF